VQKNGSDSREPAVGGGRLAWFEKAGRLAFSLLLSLPFFFLTNLSLLFLHSSSPLLSVAGGGPLSQCGRNVRPAGHRLRSYHHFPSHLFTAEKVRFLFYFKIFYKNICVTKFK
jgi:hypothetical protein